MAPLTLLLGFESRLRPAEKNALWWLYEATSGASWADNTHWDLTKDPCRKFKAPVPYRFDYPQSMPFQPGAQFEATPWIGVGCVDPCDDYLDGEDCAVGRVTSLKLRQNGLSGNLGDWQAVGTMANLTFLELSDNLLVGTLPSQLGRINHLEHIALRRNNISGTIPTELAACNANGTYSLQTVSLTRNRISGSVPTELGRKSRLMELDVSYNRMQGTLPSQLGFLSELQAQQQHSALISICGSVSAHTPHLHSLCSMQSPQPTGLGAPSLRNFRCGRCARSLWPCTLPSLVRTDSCTHVHLHVGCSRKLALTPRHLAPSLSVTHA